METFSLQAEIREKVGRRPARQLRKTGKLPAILYGRDIEAVALSIACDQVQSFIKSGARLVNLQWSGNKQTAFVKEICYDTLGEKILHLDLHRISLEDRISLSVPVQVKGLAAGLKEGGILAQHMTEIPVECMPHAIPKLIEVDVEKLSVGDAIHLSDIALPEGVRIQGNPELIVLSVHRPVEIVEAPVAVETVAAAEPEVITARRVEEPETEEEAKKQKGKEAKKE